jgi:hypothetical protein
MKIAIEHYEETYIYESKHDSIGMTDLTEKLYGLCIAAGYHPDSVGECFFEKGREMTEHLYPDDKIEVNFDSAEDVVSSGVSDPIQVDCPDVVVKSRYGDERKFNVISKNCIEYSFKDDGHTGCQRNDDGSLESVDPSGGPYIGVANRLAYIHKDLAGLTVTKIEHNDMPGNMGSYYLTVK